MRQPFEYVVLRVVPRVERGESINAGVLVHCRDADYLGAAVHLDRTRLAALDPTIDADAVDAVLQSVTDACLGSDDRGAVFRWLTAPRSTVVQAGPVHTGLTSDPAAEPERLLRLLVLPVDAP
jgi:hypothetical protein